MYENVKKSERPFLFLSLNPGWHDLNDISRLCNMTRNEVSKVLRNKPVERKSIQYRECLRDSNLVFGETGSLHSTAYWVIVDA